MYDEDEFHIKTAQPYIVLGTGKFYQHVLASLGISHFYAFHGNLQEDLEVPFLADGCSNILFVYKKDKMKSFVIGNTVQQQILKIEKNADYFGVRFQPGENPCFKDLIAKDLVGKTVELNEFDDMKMLIEKMALENNFETRMCCFMEEYRKLYNKEISNQHHLYRQLIRLIASKKGLLKITELEILSGYSARYINHIFENQSGMSAKQFCNIVKMQCILRDLNDGNLTSFSKLSSDYKFYDQAHFIHEFKDYTGKTPGDYLNDVTSRQYKNSVIGV